MEDKKKLYIVSFGDSDKYRMLFTEQPSADGLHHSGMTPLAEIERKLNDYLTEKFSEGNYAYYTSPRVTEIEWEHRDQYEDYPMLDEEAVKVIEDVLALEVKVMLDNEELNQDAPYSNVSPTAE